MVKIKYGGVWREPREETVDYPGLVVHDGRVTGSITIGHTRLPVWAVVPSMMHDGAAHIREQYPGEYEPQEIINFVYSLLDLRGEFARLLCVLAKAERNDCGAVGWWRRKTVRRRVRRALQRCVDALDAQEE